MDIAEIVHFDDKKIILHWLGSTYTEHFVKDDNNIYCFQEKL